MNKKKNILFILADQLRHDFCGCYGADFLDTPNIDALAKEGVRYENTISPSPTCVPARASLLTGRSPMENRVLDNTKWLRPDHDVMGIHTWATDLVEEGYHTAAIGKMHFYPWDISEGFQHRVIAEDKRHLEIQDDYTLYLKKHGYNRVHGSASEGYYEHLGAIISTLPDEHQIDRYVCNEVCDYLDCLDKAEPFAMMVGFPGPHCPYDPSNEQFQNMPKDTTMPPSVKATKETDQFLAGSILANSYSWNGVDITNFPEETKEKIRRHYAALVQGIDAHVGTIVKKLKDMGIYEDTILIFSSDHGDYLGDFGMAGKGLFYESSTRIPLIVRHPEQSHLEVNHLVSLTDVHHTILHFGGVSVEDSLDSTVLAPFGTSKVRESVFGCNEQGWMLRNNEHQYTIYGNGVRELYDMKQDVFQQNNLIDDPKYADIVLQMNAELIKRVFDAMNAGNTDLTAKADNYHRKVGADPFNYEGWKRPYPFPIA